MNFLVMPLFFLSGALFPLKGAPAILILVARLNPLTYGVDGLRGALVHTAQFGVAFDIGILAVLTIIALGIGSHLFSKIQA